MLTIAARGRFAFTANRHVVMFVGVLDWASAAVATVTRARVLSLICTALIVAAIYGSNLVPQAASILAAGFLWLSILSGAANNLVIVFLGLLLLFGAACILAVLFGGVVVLTATAAVGTIISRLRVKLFSIRDRGAFVFACLFGNILLYHVAGGAAPILTTIWLIFCPSAVLWVGSSCPHFGRSSSLCNISLD